MLEYTATFRLDKDVAKKAKRIAKQKGYSFNGYVNRLLAEAVGGVMDTPVIVNDGSDYYWLSPFGLYGNVQPVIFNRFIRGSIPMVGDEWDDVYDSYAEACKSLGRPICRYVESGLLIDDVDGFTKLFNAMRK